MRFGPQLSSSLPATCTALPLKSPNWAEDDILSYKSSVDAYLPMVYIKKGSATCMHDDESDLYPVKCDFLTYYMKSQVVCILATECSEQGWH